MCSIGGRKKKKKTVRDMQEDKDSTLTNCPFSNSLSPHKYSLAIHNIRNIYGCSYLRYSG